MNYSHRYSSMTNLDIPLPYSILIKRYQDLTRNDLDLIWPWPINGCWPAWFKKWNIHPPKDVFFFFFCNHHDWGFFQGYHIRAWYRIDDVICAIIRKLECDSKFYYHMILDIFRLTDVPKIIYSLARATIYFILVVTCGWISFNWRWIYTYY